MSNEQKEDIKIVDGKNFDKVIADICEKWGEVLFIKITPSFVIEVKTVISKGSYGHGYYNFDGEAALSGHLKASDIEKINFVDKFHRGMFSKSIEFNDKNNENIFKLFVTRDESLQLKKQQVELFDKLKNSFN